MTGIVRTLPGLRRKLRDTRQVFELVHPLDDAPETKCDADHISKIKMTPSVKLSLFVLRSYIIVMILLVFYSIAHQAKLF